MKFGYKNRSKGPSRTFLDILVMENYSFWWEITHLINNITIVVSLGQYVYKTTHVFQDILRLCLKQVTTARFVPPALSVLLQYLQYTASQKKTVIHYICIFSSLIRNDVHIRSSVLKSNYHMDICEKWNHVLLQLHCDCRVINSALSHGNVASTNSCSQASYLCWQTVNWWCVCVPVYTYCWAHCSLSSPTCHS